jgi:RNA recognition motif-containing protein
MSAATETTPTPYTKVFVGNLSFKTKADELAAEFSNAGKVVSANIITRGTRSLGYGFVEMENEEAAHKAVSLLNKRNVGGRDINVEVARPKEQLQAERAERAQRGEQRAPRGGRGGFRGGRGRGGRGGRRPQGERKPQDGAESTDAAPASESSETQSGDSTSAPVVRGRGAPRNGVKRQPIRRGPRAAEATTEAAPKAENGGEQSPSETTPKAQRQRPAKRPSTRRPRDNSNRTVSLTTLFVANVPFALRDEAFAELFKETSPVSAHVVITKTGRSKGFGFVEYATEEQQKAALEKLTDVVSEGRKLAIKVALNPPEKTEAPAASADVATPEAPKSEETPKTA